MEKGLDGKYVTKWVTKAKTFYVDVPILDRFCKKCGRKQIFGGLKLHVSHDKYGYKTYDESSGTPCLYMVWNCEKSMSILDRCTIPSRRHSASDQYVSMSYMHQQKPETVIASQS